MSAEVRHNEEKHRFEAGSEPNLAKIDYHVRGTTLNLIHTEVPSEYQGQGLAGKLAEAALEWAREKGFKVLPSCSYIKGYIEKHPEHADLV
jgi:predicted GNAT family acetyltransferase